MRAPQAAARYWCTGANCTWMSWPRRGQTILRLPSSAVPLDDVPMQYQSVLISSKPRMPQPRTFAAVSRYGSQRTFPRVPLENRCPEPFEFDRERVRNSCPNHPQLPPCTRYGRCVSACLISTFQFHLSFVSACLSLLVDSSDSDPILTAAPIDSACRG
jgi:hypothetical protein